MLVLFVISSKSFVWLCYRMYVRICSFIFYILKECCFIVKFLILIVMYCRGIFFYGVII